MAADLDGMQRPPAMGKYEIMDDDVTYFDRKSLADSWQRPKSMTSYHETSRTIDLSLEILRLAEDRHRAAAPTLKMFPIASRHSVWSNE